MTEETQALVDRLRDEDACWTPRSGYDIAAMRDLMRDAAAALTALARDLETARQERDHLQYANEKIVALNKGTIDSLRAKLAASDAAVRAARALAAPETPAPDAMPEKRGHQIVARDRDGMPWCETCRKWGVREDGPCDRTYPGSTGRRQEAQP